MKFQVSKRFSWNIDECVPHYYQVTGKCQPPNINGNCSITVTTILACNIDDVCVQIKKRYGTSFRIDKVIEFKKTALESSSSPVNPLASKDVTPNIKSCVECCELLGKVPSKKTKKKPKPPSSPAALLPLKNVIHKHPVQSHSVAALTLKKKKHQQPYYGSGNIILSGSAPMTASDMGNLVQNLIFTETVSNVFLGNASVPIKKRLPLPQKAQSVTVPCCTAAMTLALEFKHTLQLVKPFADFLKVNNAALPGILKIGSRTNDFIQLNLAQNQWRGALHFDGNSAVGSFRESWDVTVQFGCQSGNWQFLLSLANTQPSQKFLSRLLLNYDTTKVCPQSDAFFGFDFKFDATQLLAEPITSQPPVVNDSSGLFRNLQMEFKIVPQDIGSGSHQRLVDNSAAYDNSLLLG